MKIELKKFGNILTSRQLGKEAYLAFKPNMRNVGKSEEIEVDFSGVDVFSPSWGDEFLTPLIEEFGQNVVLSNTDNSSVKATLELLTELEGKHFKFR
ncbi:MAG: DUF4325 domain-containing protein [bacterium]|nr:DUF4325 domain-containing protein [bacterium]